MINVIKNVKLTNQIVAFFDRPSFLEMKVDSSVNDVTFVTVGSFNRLFILPILASRWNGYSLSFTLLLL